MKLHRVQKCAAAIRALCAPRTTSDSAHAPVADFQIRKDFVFPPPSCPLAMPVEGVSKRKAGVSVEDCDARLLLRTGFASARIGSTIK